MARKALPPGEKKELFNCYLTPESIRRLKTICFRRSVSKKKKLSEGQFIENAILKTPFPKAPSAEQLEAFYAIYPNLRP